MITIGAGLLRVVEPVEAMEVAEEEHWV